jgi:hypothetical protein
MDQLIAYYKAKFTRRVLQEMLDDARKQLQDPSVDGWRYRHYMNTRAAIEAIMAQPITDRE